MKEPPASTKVSVGSQGRLVIPAEIQKKSLAPKQQTTLDFGSPLTP